MHRYNIVLLPLILSILLCGCHTATTPVDPLSNVETVDANEIIVAEMMLSSWI